MRCRCRCRRDVDVDVDSDVAGDADVDVIRLSRHMDVRLEIAAGRPQERGGPEGPGARLAPMVVLTSVAITIIDLIDQS